MNASPCSLQGQRGTSSRQEGSPHGSWYSKFINHILCEDYFFLIKEGFTNINSML